MLFAAFLSALTSPPQVLETAVAVTVAALLLAANYLAMAHVSLFRDVQLWTVNCGQDRFDWTRQEERTSAHDPDAAQASLDTAPDTAVAAQAAPDTAAAAVAQRDPQPKGPPTRFSRAKDCATFQDLVREYGQPPDAAVAARLLGEPPVYSRSALREFGPPPSRATHDTREPVERAPLRGDGDISCSWVVQGELYMEPELDLPPLHDPSLPNYKAPPAKHLLWSPESNAGGITPPLDLDPPLVLPPGPRVKHVRFGPPPKVCGLPPKAYGLPPDGTYLPSKAPPPTHSDHQYPGATGI